LALSQIERAVTKLWPDLEEEIDEVNQKMNLSASVEETPRSDRELLEDILDSVRRLARIATSPGDPRESPHRAVNPDPHQSVLLWEESLETLLERLRRSVEEARSGRTDAGQPDPKDVDPDGL